jgi:hypothetical protein
MKQQSMQWVKKGQPSPLNVRVHASRTKQRFSSSLMQVCYLCKLRQGETVNASYIKTALARFLKVYREKAHHFVPGVFSPLGYRFSPRHAQHHLCGGVPGVKGGEIDPLPPYLPDLPPVDFFLFSRVKSELAGLTFFQENYRNSWEGVVWIITNEEFAAASSLPAAEGAL